MAPPPIASKKSSGEMSSPCASVIVSASAPSMSTIQLFTTSLSRVPAPASPTAIVRPPIASNTGCARSRASSGPDASTTSAPSSAGFLVPSTGASTKVTPRPPASCIRCSVAAIPTVLDWIQSASSRIDSSAPPSVITLSTAEPSASIVTTMSAPLTASAGESATGAPRPSAFSRVRFHTRVSNPAAAMFFAMGAPMMPVPRTATDFWSAVTPGSLPRTARRLTGDARAPGRLAQQDVDLLRRHGAGQVEALGQVAAELRDLLELGLCLDALGHHACVQRARHLHHRADDHGVALAQLGHERAVELQELEREVLHIAERRVAGAEVVEHGLHSELPQRGQRLRRRQRVLHELALRDLERELARVDARLAEHLRDHRDEAGLGELAGRQVHRHHQRG